MKEKGFDYRSCIRKLNDLTESIKTERKRSFDKLVENIHFDELSEEEPETEEREGFEEEEVREVNGVAYFNDIRKICLKGIGELSDDPTSVEYDTLKKIWDICDKVHNKNRK